MILVIGGFILVYWMLRGGGEPLVPLSEPTEEIVGQELLVELEKLKALREINFDDFFADPVFNSLKDTEVKPVPQPIGRKNPFSPPDSDV
ncbi:MAG: hypothetical protein G01um1014107_340 [Parcubacteria group bacterium Gr01-1014_107]|nr:MAG: hypothetical protein G01um1014107_340 [Parcubacteria group bacterium Gr01-1014_107]